MIYSKIIGTGSYLPAKILHNSDLEKMVDTSDEWITTRTGIKQRHLLSPGESTASMAEAAARQALTAAEIQADQLDLIIVSTATSDKIFVSTACQLQHRLGASNYPAFDVSAACAGFIYALHIADQMIRGGTVRTVLVVGVEALSKMIDWTDRSTCILFADGAGAVVLRASDQAGILSTHIYADGTCEDLLYADNPLGTELTQASIHMQGREVFRMAVEKLNAVVDLTLTHNHLDKSAIDWLIPHQANLRIIQATAKKLDLPLEKVILTIADQGNTSAASVPLALDCGVRDGRIKPGDLLLLEAFGGGLAWGAALIRY